MIDETTIGGILSTSNQTDEEIPKHQENSSITYQNQITRATNKQREDMQKTNCSRTRSSSSTGHSELGFWVMFGVLVLVLPSCICFCNMCSHRFVFCWFCEQKMKKWEYKEHRRKCFAENSRQIRMFKEAPAPNECPKDKYHILYQWPERASKHSGAIISFKSICNSSVEFHRTPNHTVAIL